MGKINEFLDRLDEATVNPYYQKIVEAVRKEILNNIKEMTDEKPEDVGEYAKEIAATKRAKTLSQLSNIARDMAWDYESFIDLVLGAMGSRSEDPKSAMFDPGSWDT